uniref:Uncharacterized protein n=1 Tax=Arundo donax TaxID=35708 RepID=A0A0A8Z910_ARUDO
MGFLVQLFSLKSVEIFTSYSLIDHCISNALFLTSMIYCMHMFHVFLLLVFSVLYLLF